MINSYKRKKMELVFPLDIKKGGQLSRFPAHKRSTARNVGALDSHAGKAPLPDPCSKWERV